MLERHPYLIVYGCLLAFLAVGLLCVLPARKIGPIVNTRYLGDGLIFLLGTVGLFWKVAQGDDRLTVNSGRLIFFRHWHFAHGASIALVLMAIATVIAFLAAFGVIKSRKKDF